MSRRCIWVQFSAADCIAGRLDFSGDVVMCPRECSWFQIWCDGTCGFCFVPVAAVGSTVSLEIHACVDS